MGTSFGSNWGSNNPFTGSPPRGTPLSPDPSTVWGSSRPSIFTSAGRRELRREQEQEAERAAERSVASSYLTRERRRDEEGNGSGADGHSRWTSQSDTNNHDGNANDSVWTGRGGTSGAGLWGMGGNGRNRGRLGGDRTTGSGSRRYSNYGRVTPQRRASDGDGERARSTSPPAMPGAFSPSPPRRTSTRSSRSGSGSGSGTSGGSGSGGGGGVIGWVRDRFPGGGSRRGGAGQGDAT